MRGRIARDSSDVVSDARPGEAHPVGHGGSNVFAARGDLIFAGIGITIHEIAAGIVDFAVGVGAFIFDFFEDLKVTCVGRVR